MKKQIGNDVRLEWTILRKGVAEDFTNATDLLLTAFIPNLSVDEVTIPIARVGNVFTLNIPTTDLAIGTYTIRLQYKNPDPAFESGKASISTAVNNAFQIVPIGASEDDLNDTLTSNVVYCTDGATFFPSVSVVGDEVILSWSNNKGYSNPLPIDIKGEKGDEGKSAYEYYLESTTEPIPLTEAEFSAMLGSLPTYVQEVILATNNANNAATNANNAANAATESAEDADSAAILANNAADNANTKASYAQTKGDYAKAQGDYAKAEGDYAHEQGLMAYTAANEANATNDSVQAAENLRVSAESDRVNAEANRVTQENSRISAENDRVSAENSRVSAESSRVTAETDRNTAEQTRQTNETARAAAETARNVASNIYNVTLAVPLSAGQYYTSTTARAAVPAGVRKKGLELVYETAAGVWFSERFIGSDVAAWTTAANWLLIPDKSYVDTQISNTLNVISENWVGVIVDPNLSSSEPSPKSTVVAYRATELQRTGNLNYHKFGKSRIFNAFYPAVVNRSTKQIAWRLNKNNPALKEDGTASNPDWTTQNICIVIPNLYRRIVLLDGNADGKYEVRYDIAPFDGASLFHAESYHSVGDASIDRTNTQLVSVISNDVRFRGGGNQSAWDAQHRSQLGTPLTDTSRPNFELYANNAGWQTMNIYDWTMFSELAMLYFANTNIQLDYTSVLTAEGYPQGGLGAGNTTWISKRWDGHSGYYPIDKVGEGFMSVGCNVGVKSKTLTDYYRGATTSVAANKLIATGHFSASAGWLSFYVGYTIRNISTGLTATIVAKDSDDQLSLSADIFTATSQIFQIDGVSFTYGIPVFFGLEHLYGHIWKYASGINYIVQAADAGGRSMAYVNPDWATRSAVNVDSYQYVGDIPRVDGYIKTLFPGWNIAKSNTGGSSTTYMSDSSHHANLPASGQVVRALLVSGYALNGAAAGLRYANSYYTPSNTHAILGARLRAIKL